MCCTICGASNKTNGFVKKRQLCSRCYQSLRKTGEINTAERVDPKQKYKKKSKKLNVPLPPEVEEASYIKYEQRYNNIIKELNNLSFEEANLIAMREALDEKNMELQEIDNSNTWNSDTNIPWIH